MIVWYSSHLHNSPCNCNILCVVLGVSHAPYILAYKCENLDQFLSWMSGINLIVIASWRSATRLTLLTCTWVSHFRPNSDSLFSGLIYAWALLIYMVCIFLASYATLHSTLWYIYSLLLYCSAPKCFCKMSHVLCARIRQTVRKWWRRWKHHWRVTGASLPWWDISKDSCTASMPTKGRSVVVTVNHSIVKLLS